jgi:hypothetical protein
MGFSVSIRDVEELYEDADDPDVALIRGAYGNCPLSGSRKGQRFFQFSYQALPPERIDRVIGELDGDVIGLLVESIPEINASDPFAPLLFSIPRLARELATRYPEVAMLSLDDVYSGYDSDQYDDEQVFASVLMDFARDPPSGFPVVVFLW